MIISRTPYRISFFGGGTDYPAWYLKHGGQVLSTTIDKYIYISCRYLPPFFEHRIRLVYSKLETCADVSEIQHPAARAILNQAGISDGLEIHYDGDLPARSGMGSSSAFSVGLINALAAYKGEERSCEDLAKEAIYIEQEILSESVGSQDQMNAAFGGFNHIKFRPDGEIEVRKVEISDDRKTEIKDNLMLFYTGIMRTADNVSASYVTNIEERAERLNKMSQFVNEGIDILTGDMSLDSLGKLFHENWVEKRDLSKLVSNPRVDNIYDAARAAGALGGKLTGAGGGGMMLLYVPKSRQNHVREALSGLLFIPFHFSDTGSEIIFQDQQKRYDETVSRPRDLESFIEVSEL